MSHLLLFATIEEAGPTIDLLAAKKSSQWLYEWEKGFLAITGIGSFSTFICLNAISQKVDMVSNFGLAGALNPNLELGSLHTISKCAKRHWHPKGIESTKETAAATICSDVILNTEQGITLVSSDSPVHTNLLLPFDLVDMEGYAVAFFAKAQKKPCQLYKVVSDYCNSSSPTLIKQGLKKHVEKMALTAATL